MRRRAGRVAWLWLTGTMLSMLTWRLVFLLKLPQPQFFNPSIAVWGSTCLFVSMIMFRREIAKREAAEAQRDQLLESERAAREQAEKANRSKDQFLAAVSHELRTPLAAIIGWCELLRVMPRDAVGNMAGKDLAEGLSTIERNARAQSRLVEDLLDATRITSGNLRLDLQAIHPADVVRSAIETIRPAADQKQVQLRTQVQEVCEVLGDPVRLQQVVSNLLTNAVKFTPSGGTIDVTLRTAHDTDTRWPGVELSVVDTGVGISADFLPQLFQPFRQADGTTARRSGGLGLGLSIVKNLVDLHGGHVRAHSDGPDRGSAFRVWLPAPTPAAGASGNGKHDAEHDSAIARLGLQGKRILVIEDDVDLRALMGRMLEQLGAAVEQCSSVPEALERFQQRVPDALVSDIGLPGEDGYSLIRRIRALPADVGGRVPAIAVTAFARDVDRGEAVRSGFDHHLAKPVHPVVLATTLSRALRVSRV